MEVLTFGELIKKVFVHSASMQYLNLEAFSFVFFFF